MPVSTCRCIFPRLSSQTLPLPALKPGKNLVVIGSSFISMELVVAVAKRELASIHVIGMEKVPFESILGEVVGSALMKVSEGVNS